jgi:hypothetical protein
MQCMDSRRFENISKAYKRIAGSRQARKSYGSFYKSVGEAVLLFPKSET